MAEPKTWEEGCRNAAGGVFTNYNPRVKGYPKIDLLRVQLNSASDPTRAQALWFRALGANALHGAGGDYAMDYICHILAQKQHDYGHENITRFGLQGIVVRLSDKIARLENLTKRDKDPQVDESLLDTWRDIVGYCIIASMVIDGTFELELEADQKPEPNRPPTWFIVKYADTYSKLFESETDEERVAVKEQIKWLKWREDVK